MLRFDLVQSGLRSATPDRYPVIGRAPGFGNVLVATGHFRSGILLGPLTGRLIAQMLGQRHTIGEVASFGLERFATAPS